MNFEVRLLIAVLIAGVAYRIRGGGWATLDGNDYPARLIWGAGSCVAYMFITGADVQLLFALALIPLALAEMIVPHAFCQNMGTWPSPQKRWPAFFLPSLTITQWTAMPMWARTLYDFTAMMSVAFIRGAMVFAAYLGISYIRSLFYTHEALGWPLPMWVAITFLQPLGYLLGRFWPFTVTPSLTKYSSQWGEFFNGAAWAIAFCAL